MDEIETRMLMEDVAAVMKSLISKTMTPIVERMEAMEKRLDGMPTPRDGKDSEPDEVAAIVAEQMKAELAEIRASLEAIQPAPELPDIPKLVSDAVAALPPPQDGKSVTVEDVAPLIEECVSKAVSELPPPQDGKDGVGVAGAVIDRDGNLTLTLSDGSTKQLGLIVGRDGIDVDMAAVEKMVSAKVAEIPIPKDGKDGLGFDDLRLEYDGERTFSLIFERGEEVKRFDEKLPIPIYREPYRYRKLYERGDQVTYGGSTWTALKDTEDKPGTSTDWRLSSKGGRPGKPGKDKPAEGDE